MTDDATNADVMRRLLIPACREAGLSATNMRPRGGHWKFDGYDIVVRGNDSNVEIAVGRALIEDALSPYPECKANLVRHLRERAREMGLF